MNAAIGIASPDLEAAKRRRQALDDSIDMTRRACAALLAASVHEPDTIRLCTLVRARRAALDVLAQLTALG